MRVSRPTWEWIALIAVVAVAVFVTALVTSTCSGPSTCFRCEYDLDEMVGGLAACENRLGRCERKRLKLVTGRYEFETGLHDIFLARERAIKASWCGELFRGEEECQAEIDGWKRYLHWNAKFSGCTDREARHVVRKAEGLLSDRENDALE